MKKTIAQELGITKFPFEIRDKRGNVIYRESLSGYWGKWRYNLQDMEVYFENSEGTIIEDRHYPQPAPSITLHHCLDRGFTLEKVHDKVYKEKNGKDYKICYLKLSKQHMIDYCVNDGVCEVYKLGNEGTILERKALKDVNDLDFYISFLSSQKRLRKLPKF
jgi:hypothetical protein